MVGLPRSCLETVMLALSLYLSLREHWNFHNLSVIHIALVHGFENSIHVFEYLQFQPKRCEKSDLHRSEMCVRDPLKRVNLGQLCRRFDGRLAMKVLGYSGIAPLKQVLDAFKLKHPSSLVDTGG